MKTAIITGAGQGIGEGIAYRLAKSNYAIAVVDINLKTAVKVADAIVKSGHTAKAYQVDVADREAVFHLVDQVVDDLGNLAVYVNNAGIAFIASVLDSEPAEIDRLFNVNLRGT